MFCIIFIFLRSPVLQFCVCTHMKCRHVHVKGMHVEVRGRFARLCSASTEMSPGDAAHDFRLFSKHVSPLSLLARPVFELLILQPQALSAGIVGLHQYLSLPFSDPLRVNFQGNLCSVSTYLILKNLTQGVWSVCLDSSGSLTPSVSPPGLSCLSSSSN